MNLTALAKPPLPLPSAHLTPITLTEGQKEAYDAFVGFLADPKQHTLVIGGYAGVGKSVLVRNLLDDLPQIMNMVQLLDPSAFTDWEVLLTATTNKAAEALSAATGREATTVHSALGLFVHKDYETSKTSLRLRRNSSVPFNSIIFIDEASYIDFELLRMIIEIVPDCKIVFIGDPAQLAPVKGRGIPAFESNYKQVVLTEVMRQAKGNPIIDLATQFRHTVNTGEFFSFKPDGNHIQHVSRNEFEAKIVTEFSRNDWTYWDSKVLAWTNVCVEYYNTGIRQQITNNPHFKQGDYAICNSYIANKSGSIKTDETVFITSMVPSTDMGYAGWDVVLNGKFGAFLPTDVTYKKRALADAKRTNNLSVARLIDANWVDLRAAYACTINKSQGSTYDRVFIDLDDIKKCRNGNTMARLLYVAVSRAREQVIFTGDLV